MRLQGWAQVGTAEQSPSQPVRGAWTTSSMVAAEREAPEGKCPEARAQDGSHVVFHDPVWEGTLRHFCCTLLGEAVTNPSRFKEQGGGGCIFKTGTLLIAWGD